ncbi:hypothetical protein RJ640_024958 [Escallonia rubra]|uniref:PB1 domain-containing protein n=1 Tax=Escallonia rubra TaxID=112253 RepID=A0AA88UH77_9ASTE|nr:hypothetical protein RJ640_024958 [Escallonia rubra]
MSTEGGIPGELPAPDSAAGSPKSRVKFLCSHGGKILPRPADGQLKYVGGETRVISVSRDINFPDFMKKLTYHIDGDVVLKYQLIPEDLDALVSVKSDEDLRHMFDEYDRHETEGTPRLRAYLFPARPIIVDSNQAGPMEPYAIAQRYIDAINGIVRATTPSRRLKPTPINISYASHSMSSACSSPRSPDSCISDAVNHNETMLLHSHQNGRTHMHKVHSSPSICNLNGQQQSHPSIQHHHHYYQGYRQPTTHHLQQDYQPHKPPLDPHPHRGFAPEKIIKVRSVGRAESPRYQLDHVPHYYCSTPKNGGGSPRCNKCVHFDDNGAFTERRIDRAESLPQSPRHAYFNAWDAGSMAGDN